MESDQAARLSVFPLPAVKPGQRRLQGSSTVDLAAWRRGPFDLCLLDAFALSASERSSFIAVACSSRLDPLQRCPLTSYSLCCSCSTPNRLPSSAARGDAEAGARASARCEAPGNKAVQCCGSSQPLKELGAAHLTFFAQRKKWNELLEARTSHTAVQQAALQSITSTIASSTALSTFSRQLSTDAVQIRSVHLSLCSLNDRRS